MNRTVFLLIAILSLTTTFTHADGPLPAHQQNILLAVEDSWPPYADSNGQGIATNIVKEAYLAVGINLQLKVYPYARVLDEVEKGIIVGGYNITRQASTEKLFVFGKNPILIAPASIYFSNENKKALEYASIKDIPNDSSIGVIIDYEYGDIFDDNKHRFKQVTVSNQKQIINMLRLGRLDYAIMFNAVAEHTLNEMGLAQDAIKKGPLNHTSNIYVGFSPSHEDSQFFSDQLDIGLQIIQANGVYTSLVK